MSPAPVRWWIHGPARHASAQTIVCERSDQECLCPPRNGPHGDCFGVFSLPSGQLWASGTTGPGLTTGAILGGTGAYLNMHGTFVSKSTKTGADDTVSLVA